LGGMNAERETASSDVGMAGHSLLLDTHALLWWLTDDPRLSNLAREAIADETRIVLVSAASLWEIATKNRLGKLGVADALLIDPIGIIAREGFESLSISLPHALFAGRLETDHRDPFDRMLIAQSILDGLILISNEELFDQIAHEGVAARRLW